jgi:predicted Zn finger-like uncharacterized protein
MPAPSLANVVIACPECRTRYQLARDLLADGRMVQCAKCQHSWFATAEPEAAPAPPRAPAPADEDQLFDADAESRLDAEFAAEEGAFETPGAQAGRTPAEVVPLAVRRAAAAAARSNLDSVDQRKRAAALVRRRAAMMRRLPMGRLRHSARITGILILVLLVGGGLLWRVPIVAEVPDLAGLYAAIGLPVNVVGLEFSDVHTLESLTDGVVVMSVSGQIIPVGGRRVPVPPVVVTLLSETGAALYEWSVVPPAQDLQPGETVGFETRLTQPPAGAARVRLGFANARTQQGNGGASQMEGTTS